MIDFNQIPADIRTPLVFIEFDGSQAVAGLTSPQNRILVIGQRSASGSVNAGVPTLVSGNTQGDQLFGRGSMLAEMLRALKTANNFTETWAIALDDDAAAAAATGSIAFTGTATATGTLALYIAGQAVKVAVTSGDTADVIAANVVTAIQANDRLPVSAAVDATTASTVDLTSTFKCAAANDIDVRLNYYTGQKTPAGVDAVITAMSGGTTNPDISTAITAMGDERYGSIVMPYTDDANLTALETELDDRWGPVREVDGLVYTAFRGTQSEAVTFGTARNCQYISTMDTGIAPQPPYIWAAVNGAIAAQALANDPARPLQTLVLPGLMPCAVEARRLLSERNVLLHDGVSTHTVNPSGQVQIEAQITNYQKNSFGSEDTAWLYVNTPATLSYIRYATKARITSKYPRYKLADNGTNIAPGQAIITPNVAKVELIALAREFEAAGLVEDVDTYKSTLIVQRNSSNPNRLDVQSHPNLVNQLRVWAQQMQFIV